MTSPGKARQKQAARGWFDRVFVQRQSQSGRFLQLYLGKTDRLAGGFGVSVSKRICPSASSRNYAKRLLRAWYHSHRNRLGKHDVVIRVRRQYDRRDVALVSGELEKFLSRMG